MTRVVLDRFVPLVGLLHTCVCSTLFFLITLLYSFCSFFLRLSILPFLLFSTSFLLYTFRCVSLLCISKVSEDEDLPFQILPVSHRSTSVLSSCPSASHKEHVISRDHRLRKNNFFSKQKSVSENRAKRRAVLPLQKTAHVLPSLHPFEDVLQICANPAGVWFKYDLSFTKLKKFAFCENTALRVYRTLVHLENAQITLFPTKPLVPKKKCLNICERLPSFEARLRLLEKATA